MSLNQIFKHAWDKAQQKNVCHKKLMKLVGNAFDKSNLEQLLEIFKEVLFGCYITDYADKNPYCARGLEFLAKLAIKITLECVQPIGITNPSGTTSQVYDITLDPFFTNVLKSSLRFSDVDKAEVRFNTCYFIMYLLQNIGNNVEMDYSICNIILDSLVPLLHDPKANVRIQAIKALVRLQEPTNADCIVLKSFWILSTDPNNEVRKAIINHIAPHPQSYIKVRLRTTDTDLGVRQAAYKKFADVNPKMCLKIIDRNIILNNGLNDQNKKIKHIMSETLLPKWLNFFEGDYLQFFRALRLDADENDINNFEKLCTEILDIFLRKNSLTDIVKYLPVKKEDKLIPIQQLRLESVFYWSNLINYLRNAEDGEEYLVDILPELTAFSNYIERIIKEKSSVTMDEWENLEYQTVLLQLFKIATGFDMSDEVGRKTFYALILQILTTNKFHQKVIDKILQVASQLNSDVGSLTIDLCQIISEIREPLINEVPSEDKLRKQNFEITQLKVKIHQLEINEEEALKKKDFQLAHIVQNEMKECQRKLDSLKNMFTVSEKVRVSKDDPETLCRCLDILIGLLKIPYITIMYPALRSCRDEFLMPLLSNTTSEILWRFILCLGLFSLMDKDLAFKHINFLCLPIATYRVVPNCDKLALKTSVACITDVIRVFGVKVIGMEENSQSELNHEGNPATSRRKLYSEDLSQPEVSNKDDITIEFIIDIIVDMLDDEDEGVRQTASTSIQRLIIHNFPVSPELISRLILKWYNPETEKQDTKLNIQLGTIIECFANNTKGARRVVQKAILPIISSIVNASGTSPLLEIDIENVLRFLSALTNDYTETIHDEIAMNIIERMLNKPNDACTPYLIKLLTYLELTFKDLEMCKKIVASTEMLVTDIVDKIPKKHLLKFSERLMTGFKKATDETQVDNNESHVNGTEGNIEDQSSLRKSLVNGELTNENHEQLGDIDRSEKNSEDNQKGNSSSSESDSEEDSVENNSNPNTEGSNVVKGSGKRSIAKNDVGKISKGKTKLRKITEELEQVEENNKSIDCGETTGNSGGCSNKNSAPVDDTMESTNDNSVCLKYDYTPEKNAEKLRNAKKMLNNLKGKKNQNTENDKIQIISQVELQETTKKNLGGDKLTEGSPRSTRSNQNSGNNNIQRISQAAVQETTKKKLGGDKLSEGSSRSTRSSLNSGNNAQSISQVVVQETTKKKLGEDKPSEGSSRSTRSNKDSGNNIQRISQAGIQETIKKKLGGDKSSEGSSRSTRSNQNSGNDKIQIISQVALQETTKKNLGADKLSKESSRSTRSNLNSGNNNVQIISQVVVQETIKKKLDSDNLSEGSSRSTRPNLMKAKKNTDSTTTTEKLKNRQRLSSNKDTPDSTETDGERKNTPNKQSLRKTSIPSKFKDFVTPSIDKHQSRSKASPNNEIQVEKRVAETPLSNIVERKSKRLSKSSTTEEASSTPNKVTNSADDNSFETPSRNRKTPLSSVGKRLSRIFSKSATKVSNKKLTKKSRPSLVVGLRKSLRNTSRSSKRYLRRPLETPTSPLRKSPNKIKKTKELQVKKFGTKLENSKSQNENDKEKSFESALKGKTLRPINKGIPKNRKVSRIAMNKKSDRNPTKDDDESSDEESSKNMNISGENCKSGSSGIRKNEKRTIETEKTNKKTNSKKQIDEIRSKKNNAEKTSAKRKANSSQKGKRNEISNSSTSGEDEDNSTNSSDSVFKKPKRKISKEKPKDKINNKRSSNDGVLQSLNSVMNEINNSSINRKSSRIADKSGSKSLSTDNHSTKTKSKTRLQQDTHSTTQTRSRMSDRLNESKSSSRKKLDFSSFSDETILKTFLQGDEEFQVLESMCIEDVNSLSNTSHDSKKENVSINVSTTSSSSRRSTRRKRISSSSPESPPPPSKKKLRTKYKRNLQRVSQ